MVALRHQSLHQSFCVEGGTTGRSQKGIKNAHGGACVAGKGLWVLPLHCYWSKGGEKIEERIIKR